MVNVVAIRKWMALQTPNRGLRLTLSPPYAVAACNVQTAGFAWRSARPTRWPRAMCKPRASLGAQPALRVAAEGEQIGGRARAVGRAEAWRSPRESHVLSG